MGAGDIVTTPKANTFTETRLDGKPVNHAEERFPVRPEGCPRTVAQQPKPRASHTVHRAPEKAAVKTPEEKCCEHDNPIVGEGNTGTIIVHADSGSTVQIGAGAVPGATVKPVAGSATQGQILSGQTTAPLGIDMSANFGVSAGKFCEAADKLSSAAAQATRDYNNGPSGFLGIKDIYRDLTYSNGVAESRLAKSAGNLCEQEKQILNANPAAGLVPKCADAERLGQEVVNLARDYDKKTLAGNVWTNATRDSLAAGSNLLDACEKEVKGTEKKD